VYNNGGTYGINISGNAGTATTASNSNAVDGQTLAALDSRYSPDRIQSSASAIGAYILGAVIDTSIVAGPGSTLSGSLIRFSDASGNTVGGTLTGTWRCHGMINTTSITSVSVFQRVA
jgi:hypothetical protein